MHAGLSFAGTPARYSNKNSEKKESSRWTMGRRKRCEPLYFLPIVIPVIFPSPQSLYDKKRPLRNRCTRRRDDLPVSHHHVQMKRDDWERVRGLICHAGPNKYSIIYKKTERRRLDTYKRCIDTRYKSCYS